MYQVYVYDKNADDFSTTGLCGALFATSCEHEEIGNGLSAITLQHPFDPYGKWRYLKNGNILKVMCRVRTTLEMDEEGIVTSVEKWRVKSTATKNRRGVFTKSSYGRRKTTLKAGTEVIVVYKGATRYKIKWRKQSGWISTEGIESLDEPITIADTTDSMDQLIPPWTVRTQLFRIRNSGKDTESGELEVYALHYSYDLDGNVTRYKTGNPISAQVALFEIMYNCDFEHEFSASTNILDERVAADWTNVSPTEALLDPETGFTKRWGLELVRDDVELFFLKSAGRDRGVRIEYGKDLLGVSYEISEENIITAVLPVGETKKGNILYLTGTVPSVDNYVMSPNASNFAVQKAEVLPCTGCKVSDSVTTTLARTRMRAQAEQRFTVDKVDQPAVTLVVTFISLGDTIEYAQYKNLTGIYLFDTIYIYDMSHDIEVAAKVTRIKWDCLRGRMLEIEVSNIVPSDSKVYKWQLPYGISGALFASNTVPVGALAEDTGSSIDITQNTAAWKVNVLSSDGTVVVGNPTKSTTLSIVVISGGIDITDDIDASRVYWTRQSADAVADALWAADYIGVKSLVIPAVDRLIPAKYNAIILAEEEV